MKEGWKYKKLGEVADISAGQGAPQGDNNYCDDGTPFIKAGNLEELINGLSEYEVQMVSDDVAKSHHLKKYKKGSVLFAKSGMSCMKGWVYTLKNDCYVVSHLAIVTPIKINSKFLNYYLNYNKPNSLVQDSAYPSISLKDILNLIVPIPEIKEQEQIVSELDLLSGVIEKQKAQIEELDKLAQSIFYDMFGDPATNPKSWDIKTIGEIGTVERGAGISKKDFVADGIPCIHYGQLHTCLGAITHKHITCIPKALLPKYKIAHAGDVIMAITSEDVDGSCTSTAWLGKYDIVVGSDAAILHHSLNGVYISYYTRTKAFFNEKAKYAKGFKVTHISTSEISSIHIPIPPLSLQQAFAEKIEAIEAMKSQIRQSLKESEQLFNSRMDYYFN